MNTNISNKETKNKLSNTHQTEAILDVNSVTNEANVPIPSEEAVEAAKEWVDENEK